MFSRKPLITVAYTSLCLFFGVVGGARALPMMGDPFYTDPAVPYLYDVSPSDVATATDGENFLAVWEDNGGYIHGMLVSGEGDALAPHMLDLDPQEPDVHCYYPDVAFGGGRYLVVWNASTTVAAQLVDTDGARVGDPIVLDEMGYYAEVEWNGTAFFVTWEKLRDSGQDMAVALVDPDGTVLSSDTPIETGNVTAPALAISDSDALIAWYANGSEGERVYAAILSQEGQMGILAPFAVSDGAGVDITVGSDGTSYLVVWKVSGSPYEINGAIVDGTGSVGASFPIASGESLSKASVAFDGENFAVVYRDYIDGEPAVRLVKVSADGVVANTPINADHIASDTRATPALLWTGDRYWVVYDGENGVSGIFSDNDLLPEGDPVELSTVPHPQNSAAVLFDSKDYVLTWTDEREGESLFSSHTIRVNQAGRIVGDVLNVTSPENRGSWISATTMGAGVIVGGWMETEGDSAYLRSFASDGSLSNVTPFAEVPIDYLSVASDGSGYMMLVVDSTTTPNVYVAYLQKLDAGGLPEGELQHIRTQESYMPAGFQAAATGYLFYYRDEDTYMLPISAAGEVSDPLFVETGTIRFDAANNGTETLVVWSTMDDVLRGRFYSEGTWKGDVFDIATDSRYGDVKWDGNQFVLVWSDSEHYGQMATVDTSGQVSEKEPLFADEECTGPELGSNGAGQLLLSCIRYEHMMRTRRIVNYLLGEPVGAEIEPEETDTDDNTAEEIDSEVKSDEDTDPGTEENDDEKADGTDEGVLDEGDDVVPDDDGDAINSDEGNDGEENNEANESVSEEETSENPPEAEGEAGAGSGGSTPDDDNSTGASDGSEGPGAADTGEGDDEAKDDGNQKSSNDSGCSFVTTAPGSNSRWFSVFMLLSLAAWSVVRRRF